MNVTIPGELKFLAGAIVAAIGFVYLSTDGQVFKEGGINPASLNNQSERISSGSGSTPSKISGASEGGSAGAEVYSESEMAKDFAKNPKSLDSSGWAKTKFDREKMTVSQYGRDASGNEYILELPVDEKVIVQARKNIASGRASFTSEPNGAKANKNDIASFERTINSIESELTDVRKRKSN